MTELFGTLGWPCGPVAEDLGEDLLVQIYEKGSSTGLSFYVQLKSTRNLGTHRSTQGVVGYPVPVKDLLHWENSSPPVVLVLWDITARGGLWARVDDLTPDLDKARPAWRERAGRSSHNPARTPPPKVTVHLPGEYSCDREGLTKLRHLLAKAAYPSISKGKDFEITGHFTFPDTEEGQAQMRALEESINAGNPIDLSAKYVQGLEFPDWWTRLFGEVAPYTASVAMTPNPSREILPFGLEVKAASGRRVEVPYIGLRALKSGLEETTFSNATDGADAPILLTVVARAEGGVCRLAVPPAPPEGVPLSRMIKTCEILRCASEGASVTLTPHGRGALPAMTSRVPPQPEFAPPAEFITLLDDLALISDKVGVLFMLPKDVLTKDASVTSAIATILRDGAHRRVDDLSLTITREGVTEMLASAHFPTTLRVKQVIDQPIVLFGTELPLGALHVAAEGALDRDTLETAIRTAAADQEAVPIVIRQTKFTSTFSVPDASKRDDPTAARGPE